MTGGCPINIDFLNKNWSYKPTDVLNSCHRIGWTNSDSYVCYCGM